MDYKPYPAYRDSGVEWLGQIPEGWEIKTAKQLFANRREAQLDDDEQLTASQKYGVIPQRLFMELADQKVALALLGTESFKHVQKDDFVISLRSFEGGIERAQYSGCITPAYTVLKMWGKGVPDFWAYCFKSYGFISMFSTLSESLRDGKAISYTSFSKSRLPVPPLPTQKAIAAFLDAETARMDELRTDYEELIALLQEKRQALISHAVTRGLSELVGPEDPEFGAWAKPVAFKDSGVEWLGEIPEGWEVYKVSHMFTASKGRNAAQLTKEFCATIEGEYPVYSGQTENNGIMAKIDDWEFDAGNVGYLLSTTVGAKAMSITHILDKFSLSQNCMVIVPTKVQIMTRFYYYHFQPLFLFERALIPEHMQASFRMEDLYAYRIAYPGEDEQAVVAGFLDRETAKIDALVKEAREAVELIKERRAALITEAVTGKINVEPLA